MYLKMTNFNNTTFTGKDEEKQTERKPNVNRLLAGVALIGLGCAIYGFMGGYKMGYRRGGKDGIVFMTEKFLEATSAIAEEARKPEGE
jgi:hypothetical protein